MIWTCVDNQDASKFCNYGSASNPAACTQDFEAWLAAEAPSATCSAPVNRAFAPQVEAKQRKIQERIEKIRFQRERAAALKVWKGGGGKSPAVVLHVATPKFKFGPRDLPTDFTAQEIFSRYGHDLDMRRQPSCV